jgi:calcineurin-like phosphoesterase family protein
VDYFISDMHFGHKKIIGYCNRPWKTVQEMNDGIVRRWNHSITDGDRVFVVGDVFLMDPKDATPIVNSLNGYKILIAGNHDRSEKTMLACGFDEYHREYDYMLEGFGPGLLNHYPLPDTVIVDRGYSFMVHGHIHDPPMIRGLKINVAVDVNDFKPVSELNLMEVMPLLTNKSEQEVFDVSIVDGRVEAKILIDSADFSGVSDTVYRMLKQYYKKGKR